MSKSDVRDIESLENLRLAIERLAERLTQSGHSISAMIARTDQHFSHQVPAHWREQTRRAERALATALDQLGRKQATLRAGDQAPATEERKNVARWKARLRFAQEREQLSRRVATEMSQLCDRTRGPTAALHELGEVSLPTAAARLLSLINRLREYQDGKSN